MFQADELLLALGHASVRFVVIGGIAVGVHGYVRATKDLDIVPDPERENLVRLAVLLRELGAEHVGVGEFTADEFPYDPTDPKQLAQGANFRLETRLGPLDIMQWVAGLEEDPAYPALAREAIAVAFRGEQVLVCGLDHLRAMKRAAGREEDLRDLRELDA
jgi:hypothetical protein